MGMELSSDEESEEQEKEELVENSVK